VRITPWLVSGRTRGSIVDGREVSQEVAQVEARDIADWVSRLVAEGDVRRITLRPGDRVLLDLPLRRGVAAGVATALRDHAAAVARIADTVARWMIEVEREGDETGEGREEPLHAHIVRSRGPLTAAHEGEGDRWQR
jgi:hypothetical protein